MLESSVLNQYIDAYYILPYMYIKHIYSLCLLMIKPLKNERNGMRKQKKKKKMEKITFYKYYGKAVHCSHIS